MILEHYLTHSSGPHYNFRSCSSSSRHAVLGSDLDLVGRLSFVLSSNLRHPVYWDIMFQICKKAVCSLNKRLSYFTSQSAEGMWFIAPALYPISNHITCVEYSFCSNGNCLYLTAIFPFLLIYTSYMWMEVGRQYDHTKHVAFLSCSKSQSLTNAFSFTESSFFRSSVNEDEAKAETIRNLRKSFASLFSD